MKFAAVMTAGIFDASEDYSTKSLCISKIFKFLCHMA